MANVFSDLVQVNVNEHTEKRDGLTYLSWPWAWAEVKKRYPDANYTVWRGSDNLPYVYDERTGYMVSTTVTIDGVTHEMWLPVMDSGNRAMKSEPYKVVTKYREVTVAPATMFDVNKAIMRCLTKNLAMFGLGLYIYAGTDLPDVQEEEAEKKPATVKKVPGKEAYKASEVVAEEKPRNVVSAVKVSKISDEQRMEIMDLIRNSFPDKESRNKAYMEVVNWANIAKISDLTTDKVDKVKGKIAELADIARKAN